MVGGGNQSPDPGNGVKESKNVMNGSAVVLSVEGEPLLVVEGLSISATVVHDAEYDDRRGLVKAQEDCFQNESRLADIHVDEPSKGVGLANTDSNMKENLVLKSVGTDRDIHNVVFEENDALSKSDCLGKHAAKVGSGKESLRLKTEDKNVATHEGLLHKDFKNDCDNHMDFKNIKVNQTQQKLMPKPLLVSIKRDDEIPVQMASSETCMEDTSIVKNVSASKDYDALINDKRGTMTEVEASVLPVERRSVNDGLGHTNINSQPNPSSDAAKEDNRVNENDSALFSFDKKGAFEVQKKAVDEITICYESVNLSFEENECSGTGKEGNVTVKQKLLFVPSKNTESVCEIQQDNGRITQSANCSADGGDNVKITGEKECSTVLCGEDVFGAEGKLPEKSSPSFAAKEGIDGTCIMPSAAASHHLPSDCHGASGIQTERPISPGEIDALNSSGENGGGNLLIGRKLRKKFGRRFYFGSVISFDEENSWYKVTYEDGDEEDLEWEELKPILIPAKERELKVRKGKTPMNLGPKSRVFKRVGKAQASKKLKGRKRKRNVPRKQDSTTREHPDDEQHDKTNLVHLDSVDKLKDENIKENLPERPTMRKRKAETDWILEGQRMPCKRPARELRHQRKDAHDSSRSDASEVQVLEKVNVPGRGTSLVGRKTKKDFGGQLYAGEVINYDPVAGYYKVKYEDGDEEELEWSELEATLIPIDHKPLSFKEMLRARTLAARGSMKDSSTTDIDDSSGVGETPKNKSIARDDPILLSASDEVKVESKQMDSVPTLLVSDAPVKAVAFPPRPLAAARFASAADADIYEYYSWGEAGGFDRAKCPELRAAKLLPTSSPIVHLAASQHHLAAITAAGQVWLWRNRHGNIHTRCNEWEHISCLEDRGVILVDVAGPDLDRKQSGYEADQEDQVPDPFYLVAIGHDGQDYILQGSQAQEPVRTYQHNDEPRYASLIELLAESSNSSADEVGNVVQVSVGTVEAPDESPFIGYITDTGRVYIRSATKDYMDEANLVSGFTGKPIKIQCGRVFHAIIMTDDGRAWTWGHGYYPGDKALGSSGFPVATCQPAVGTLVGRKVIDIGCYGEDFIALTNDGDVHQWTHAVPNPAAGVYNVPATPLYGRGPCIPHGEKLKQVAIGTGMCSGVTETGTVHTWRTDMKGGFSGLAVPERGGGVTPLGHEENHKDTTVSSLGHRSAARIICVAGSLIVVVRKRSRGRIGSKKRVDRSKVESAAGNKE